ncbi:hypothetical protein GCM10010260_73280 [Streptomyces filipinensis]|uniref:Uncharacterized protein n=1 Tax=Streptomyces filipinensis TaxID=66887 RepID=A0A918MEM7_9ACTN|nr:hypothetical protein GCM10010260_73280 [Streptomyces filipinensis]
MPGREDRFPLLAEEAALLPLTGRTARSLTAFTAEHAAALRAGLTEPATAAPPVVRIRYAFERRGQ